MALTSIRRYDLGSATQPITQFIAATLPFFFLLLWFLLEAHMRPNSSCYDVLVADDDQAKTTQSAECSKLIPLKQFIYVYLAAEFCWLMLAVYLTFYVPRRHNLVEAYLTQGETVIGDVYFNRKKRGTVSLTSYGHVVYPHDSKLIHRQVQVFERYTREVAAILYLPGLPLSGQPKVDLEIDREVVELNRPRMEILFWYSWAWAAFCALAPLYIIEVLKVFNHVDATVWQPDANQSKVIAWSYVAALTIIPAMAFFWNVAAWLWYKRWMTVQHKVLEEGQPANERERGCCFDDDECESIDARDYVPPSANDTDGITKVGIA